MSALCRLSGHRWLYRIGTDLAGGATTVVTIRSCRRKCGIPDKIVSVKRTTGPASGAA